MLLAFGRTLLYLATLLSQHVGIENGGKVGLVFLLVVGLRLDKPSGDTTGTIGK